MEIFGEGLLFGLPKGGFLANEHLRIIVAE